MRVIYVDAQKMVGLLWAAGPLKSKEVRIEETGRISVVEKGKRPLPKSEPSMSEATEARDDS